MLSEDQRGQEQRMAWTTIFRINALFQQRLEDALRSEADMSLAEHELLAVLSAADGRLRMGELTERLLFSKSGITRLVAKVEERDGWVTRVLCPEDRRATWAELTDTGWAAITESALVVRKQLDELFGNYLSSAELRRITDGLNHLINANEWFRSPR